MPFKYKKVLVVGATSGIGEALAVKFVEDSSSVIAVGRRQDRLDALVDKYGEDKIRSVAFDISELDQIPAFVKRVTEAHPDLDCIFLNSGVQYTFDFSKPNTVDFEKMQYEFRVNYFSFISMTKEFLPFLLQKDTPTAIIYTTSGLALTPHPQHPGYSSTKAALHAFTLCLREQLKATSVKVIELLPPLVESEIHDAKNQPERGGKIPVGMPLVEYTQLTYEGLVEGNEHVPIGTAKVFYAEDGFETLRQAATQELFKRVSSE